MAPKQAKTRAGAAKASTNSDSDYEPNTTAPSAPAMGTDAQSTAQEDYDADTEEGSIYETVQEGRSVNRGKAPIVESSSEEENEADDEGEESGSNDNDAGEGEEESEEEQSGAAAVTSSNVRPKRPRTMKEYYYKPRHEIVAEDEAATGLKWGYDDEEGHAYCHLEHLFKRACPLPSLNGKTIRNDLWLEHPRDTLAAIQDRAPQEMAHPTITEEEIEDDLADMRAGVQFKAWSSHDEDENVDEDDEEDEDGDGEEEEDDEGNEDEDVQMGGM
jgi:hypothetical protein